MLQFPKAPPPIERSFDISNKEESESVSLGELERLGIYINKEDFKELKRKKEQDVIKHQITLHNNNPKYPCFTGRIIKNIVGTGIDVYEKNGGSISKSDLEKNAKDRNRPAIYMVKTKPDAGHAFFYNNKTGTISDSWRATNRPLTRPIYSKSLFENDKMFSKNTPQQSPFEGTCCMFAIAEALRYKSIEDGSLSREQSWEGIKNFYRKVFDTVYKPAKIKILDSQEEQEKKLEEEKVEVFQN